MFVGLSAWWQTLPSVELQRMPDALVFTYLKLKTKTQHVHVYNLWYISTKCIISPHPLLIIFCCATNRYKALLRKYQYNNNYNYYPQQRWFSFFRHIIVVFRCIQIILYDPYMLVYSQNNGLKHFHSTSFAKRCSWRSMQPHIVKRVSGRASSSSSSNHTWTWNGSKLTDGMTDISWTTKETFSTFLNCAISKCRYIMINAHESILQAWVRCRCYFGKLSLVPRRAIDRQTVQTLYPQTPDPTGEKWHFINLYTRCQHFKCFWQNKVFFVDIPTSR